MEAIEQATTFGLNMVTLPSHTSHALWPLDANYFNHSKMPLTIRSEILLWQKINYLEQNKVTFPKWVNKVVQQFLKKGNIKSRFKVCRIWP
jgi:hypothetical protein